MIVEEPVPYAGIARIRFDGLADRASQPLTGTPTASATLMAARRHDKTFSQPRLARAT